MSEPRHAMIYRDAVEKKWWLEIVQWDVNNKWDALSNNADCFGPFETSKQAQEYASDNFQNTGFEIPVLDPEVFAYMSQPNPSGWNLREKKK